MAGRMNVRRAVTRLEDVVEEGAVYYGAQASRPGEVVRLLSSLLEREPVEVFMALALNTRHRVLACYEVSRGTLTASLVHPREVFSPALQLRASSMIVAHNHPSGDPEPSHEDRAVTRRLLDAGELLGVPLLDHLVIGADGRWVSLRERMGL